MLPLRTLLFFFLSVFGLGALLYYTVLPQGPQLFYSFQQSELSLSTEMTFRVEKFTPEWVKVSLHGEPSLLTLARALLGAPRRSAAVPNARGTLALYTVSTYSFESHKKTTEIKVLDISNGQSSLITNEEKTSEPKWLGDGNEIVWLKEQEKGITHLIHGDSDDVGKNYIIGVVPAPISDVKLKPLERGKIAIAVVGKARPDGSLYNSEEEPKKHSSGLVYDGLMVRHWDKYVTRNKNAIWYGLLQQSKPHITETHGRYSLSNLTNALKDSHLESPVPPFGGTDHFDISSIGIIFVAKDPALNPATNTKSDCYFLPISDFSSPPSSKPRKIEVGGYEGAASSPVFSSSGLSASYLQMKENGYESDKNHVFVIPDFKTLPTGVEVLKPKDGKELWDRSPSAVTWGIDDKSLLLQAEENGKDLLFRLDLPSDLTDIVDPPHRLTETGAVSEVRPLADDSKLLFVSSTNLVDNSFYTIIDPSKPSEARLISSNSRNGTFFGLSVNQVSDIWFKGAGDYKVHAWVVKPSNFTEGKKYPLAYLVHGGPQGAWVDKWSTRWNPAVFAEQGYVVVTPNPTGSTGYGQTFCDAIHKSWGGRPYEDLVKGFDYIHQNLAFVDTDRAVALGASYGGYMMNWIQGHPLGRKFKALVCHDGVFSMANQISSDEQYFPIHDLGGEYWKAIEDWEKWNPARFTGNWSTPQLVIHNELDYRLPISEGLAAFNVLQERKIESRFLTFPDENHWVIKEENSLVWHTVVLNFINRFVGLPAYKEEENQGFEVQSSSFLTNDKKPTTN